MDLAKAAPGTVMEAARAEGTAKRRRHKPVAKGPEAQLQAVVSGGGSAIPPPMRLAQEGQVWYMRARDLLLGTARSVARYEQGHWWLTDTIAANMGQIRVLIGEIERIVDLAPSYEAARVAVRTERAAKMAEVEETSERRLETARTEKGLERAQRALADISLQRARKELSARFAAQMGIEPGPLTYTVVAEEMEVYIYLLNHAGQHLLGRFNQMRERYESSPDLAAPPGVVGVILPAPGRVLGVPVIREMFKEQRR